MILIPHTRFLFLFLFPPSYSVSLVSRLSSLVFDRLFNLKHPVHQLPSFYSSIIPFFSPQSFYSPPFQSASTVYYGIFTSTSDMGLHIYWLVAVVDQ
ncbi:hypothetical protein BOTBODRAFT_586705 [Botryobasidium botryosum FD-172 SS1]|uniref:Uncharacterized protein n=1 Tax=Botryobasidium botryosum (strain FD-172 SS1) TaxID=930990 RepID=A0A067M868_BOTB1|nr:hypothetical protein BOTBODRAFT_586705 [Botryobasidium botryosum FD-172 SS1]